MAASLRIEPTDRPLVRLPHFVPRRNMHHAPEEGAPAQCRRGGTSAAFAVTVFERLQHSSGWLGRLPYPSRSTAETSAPAGGGCMGVLPITWPAVGSYQVSRAMLRLLSKEPPQPERHLSTKTARERQKERGTRSPPARRRVCSGENSALLRTSQSRREILEEAAKHFTDRVSLMSGAERVATSLLFNEQHDEALSLEGRQRALVFLCTSLEAASDAFTAFATDKATDAVSSAQAEPAPWVKQTVEYLAYNARYIRSSADKLGQQLSRRNGGQGVQDAVDDWWTRAEPLLKVLLASPRLPQLVADLMDGISHIADRDVARSLRWLRAATPASIQLGLPTDQLVADRIVKHLGRLLADHRTLLAEDDTARQDFLAILEAYLEVGWPKAIQLGAQVEGIFR